MSSLLSSSASQQQFSGSLRDGVLPRSSGPGLTTSLSMPVLSDMSRKDVLRVIADFTSSSFLARTVVGRYQLRKSPDPLAVAKYLAHSIHAPDSLAQDESIPAHEDLDSLKEENRLLKEYIRVLVDNRVNRDAELSRCKRDLVHAVSTIHQYEQGIEASNLKIDELISTDMIREEYINAMADVNLNTTVFHDAYRCFFDGGVQLKKALAGSIWSASRKPDSPWGDVLHEIDRLRDHYKLQQQQQQSLLVSRSTKDQISELGEGGADTDKEGVLHEATGGVMAVSCAEDNFEYIFDLGPESGDVPPSTQPEHPNEHVMPPPSTPTKPKFQFMDSLIYEGPVTPPPPAPITFGRGTDSVESTPTSSSPWPSPIRTPISQRVLPLRVPATPVKKLVYDYEDFDSPPRLRSSISRLTSPTLSSLARVSAIRHGEGSKPAWGSPKEPRPSTPTRSNRTLANATMTLTGSSIKKPALRSLDANANINKVAASKDASNPASIPGNAKANENVGKYTKENSPVKALASDNKRKRRGLIVDSSAKLDFTTGYTAQTKEELEGEDASSILYTPHMISIVPSKAFAVIEEMPIFSLGLDYDETLAPEENELYDMDTDDDHTTAPGGRPTKLNNSLHPQSDHINNKIARRADHDSSRDSKQSREDDDCRTVPHRNVEDMQENSEVDAHNVQGSSVIFDLAKNDRRENEPRNGNARRSLNHDGDGPAVLSPLDVLMRTMVMETAEDVRLAIEWSEHERKEKLKKGVAERDSGKLRMRYGGQGQGRGSVNPDRSLKASGDFESHTPSRAAPQKLGSSSAGSSALCTPKRAQACPSSSVPSRSGHGPAGVTSSKVPAPAPKPAWNLASTAAKSTTISSMFGIARRVGRAVTVGKASLVPEPAAKSSTPPQPQPPHQRRISGSETATARTSGSASRRLSTSSKPAQIAQKAKGSVSNPQPSGIPRVQVKPSSLFGGLKARASPVSILPEHKAALVGRSYLRRMTNIPGSSSGSKNKSASESATLPSPSHTRSSSTATITPETAARRSSSSSYPTPPSTLGLNSARLCSDSKNQRVSPMTSPSSLCTPTPQALNIKAEKPIATRKPRSNMITESSHIPFSHPSQTVQVQHAQKASQGRNLKCVRRWGTTTTYTCPDDASLPSIGSSAS